MKFITLQTLAISNILLLTLTYNTRAEGLARSIILEPLEYIDWAWTFTLPLHFHMRPR